MELIILFYFLYYRNYYRYYSFTSRFFEIFEKYGGHVDGHVKLKRPKQLQEILDIARSLLNEIEHHSADPEIEEKQGKLEQLKSVLEMLVVFFFKCLFKFHFVNFICISY